MKAKARLVGGSNRLPVAVWTVASPPVLALMVWLIFCLCLQLVFYTLVQTLYTLGHSLSLVALVTGSAILCLFR